MRFGFPGMDNLRYHQDYVLSYDKRNRTAHWVVEHLTRENLKRSEDVKRGESTFREDPTVSCLIRVLTEKRKTSLHFCCVFRFSTEERKTRFSLTD